MSAEAVSFAIPHGGGKRFAKDSLEYRVIEEWIAAGAPPPTANDAADRGLEVFPAAAFWRRRPNSKSWCALAIPTDHAEDVTRWVKFSSSNEGVATVDDWGRVKMTGSGEAAITLVVFQPRSLFTPSVPFANEIDADVYERYPAPQFHRRPGGEMEEPAPGALEDRRRLRVSAARLSRCRSAFCPPRKTSRTSSPTVTR
jgi:hypothetical protein